MPHKIVIYTKNYCPYCDRAKEYFRHRGLAFDEVDVTHDPQLYTELKARTQHMTVPQIFIDGVFIGGYTDMIDKIRAGTLVLTAPAK